MFSLIPVKWLNSRDANSDAGYAGAVWVEYSNIGSNLVEYAYVVTNAIAIVESDLNAYVTTTATATVESDLLAFKTTATWAVVESDISIYEVTTASVTVESDLNAYVTTTTQAIVESDLLTYVTTNAAVTVESDLLTYVTTTATVTVESDLNVYVVTNAAVTVTDVNPSTSDATLNFTFTIPTGATGSTGSQGAPGVCPTCPPSGGSGSMQGYVVWNPFLIEMAGIISVGGTNTTKTVAQAGYAPANYPGMTVASTDLFDWANLQYSLYLEKQSGKKVLWFNKFQVNKTVLLNDYDSNLSLDGNFCTITSVQSVVWSTPVIGSRVPTDNGDANIMVLRTFDIRNIIIQASPNQAGLQPGPSYSSIYEGIRVFNARVGMKLEFSLNSIARLCDAGTCDTAFMAASGNWPGASNSNSQSNHHLWDHCHSYHGTPNGYAKVGFGNYSSSGVFMKDCILEGSSFRKGVDHDFKMSTVVKTGGSYNTHIEGIYGNRGCASGDANHFIRMVGTYTISNSYSQYTGCMINASGSPGELLLNVEETPWVVVPPDGKLLVNAGGVFWQFKDNGAQEIRQPQNLNSKFYIGTVPGGNGTACVMNPCFQCGTSVWSVQGWGGTSGIYSFNSFTSARTAAPTGYKLELTMKPDALASINRISRLTSSRLNEYAQGTHTWYFDTEAEAVTFANANPDFNHLITKL